MKATNRILRSDPWARNIRAFLTSLNHQLPTRLNAKMFFNGNSLEFSRWYVKEKESHVFL